jgi:uncharacterized protein YggE
MKDNWAPAIILFFIALFVYTKLAGPIPFFVNSVNTTKTDLFSASGEGKATAVPDQATIDLGITQTAVTVTDAQNKTNQTANKIIAAIKKLGIADKDIKTDNYSVNPNYGNSAEVNGGVMLPVPPDGQNIVGYTVTQNLEVNVKPIENVNKIIDAATQNGANLVGGVNFTFSDTLSRSLQQQATTQAVADAKDQAQRLAQAAGLHLGNIVNVVTNSNQPMPLTMSAAGGVKTDATAPTNITPGQNSVTIDVVIYYETY